MSKKTFKLANIEFGSKELFLIAGPCVIEEESLMLQVAKELKRISQKLSLPIVYKSSFIKDNRSSLSNYYGPGLESGLKTLAKIKQETGLPLLSDIHDVTQVDAAAKVLDIIQIPAYLCMQTGLVVATAKSGKIINLKHGQFLAPQNMKYPLNKVLESGNDKIILTERGVSFGYNDLVVDPRAFYEMQQLDFPVVFDITHSIRKYGIPSSDKTGGARQYIPILAKTGVAAGVDGVFIEVHPNPDQAKCDAASQLKIDELEKLLMMILDFHTIANKYK